MNTKTHSRNIPAQERGREIRVDSVRALARWRTVAARTLKSAPGIAVRLWVALLGFAEPCGARQAATLRPAQALNGGGFALFELRPRRVCHACCRLNKAPPKP